MALSTTKHFRCSATKGFLVPLLPLLLMYSFWLVAPSTCATLRSGAAGFPGCDAKNRDPCRNFPGLCSTGGGLCVFKGPCEYECVCPPDGRRGRDCTGRDDVISPQRAEVGESANSGSLLNSLLVFPQDLFWDLNHVLRPEESVKMMQSTPPPHPNLGSGLVSTIVPSSVPPRFTKSMENSVDKTIVTPPTSFLNEHTAGNNINAASSNPSISNQQTTPGESTSNARITDTSPPTVFPSLTTTTAKTKSTTTTTTTTALSSTKTPKTTTTSSMTTTPSMEVTTRQRTSTTPMRQTPLSTTSTMRSHNHPQNIAKDNIRGLLSTATNFPPVQEGNILQGSPGDRSGRIGSSPSILKDVNGNTPDVEPGNPDIPSLTSPPPTLQRKMSSDTRNHPTPSTKPIDATAFTTTSQTKTFSTTTPSDNIATRIVPFNPFGSSVSPLDPSTSSRKNLQELFPGHESFPTFFGDVIQDRPSEDGPPNVAMSKGVHRVFYPIPQFQKIERRRTVGGR